MNHQYRSWPPHYPGGFINPQFIPIPAAPVTMSIPSPVIPHAPALSAHSPVLNTAVLSGDSDSSSDDEPPRVINARRGRDSLPKRHRSRSRSKSTVGCDCKGKESECKCAHTETKQSCPCTASDYHASNYPHRMVPPWWHSPYHPEYPYAPYLHPQEAPWKVHQAWLPPRTEHVSPIESTGIPPLIVPDTSYAYVPAADIPWATPAPSLITMEQPLEKKEPENKKKKKNESKEIKLNPAWGKFGSKQALVESSTTLSHRKLSQISIHPLLTLETCRTLLFCNVFGAAPELTNDEQDIEEFLHDPATVPRLTAVTLSLGPAGSLSIINRHGVLVGDILTQIQQYMEREIERSFWDKLPHVQRHNAKESCRRRRAAGHVSSSRVVMGDLLEGNIIFSGMASPARGSGGVFETHWEEH